MIFFQSNIQLVFEVGMLAVILLSFGILILKKDSSSFV